MSSCAGKPEAEHGTSRAHRSSIRGLRLPLPALVPLVAPRLPSYQMYHRLSHCRLRPILQGPVHQFETRPRPNDTCRRQPVGLPRQYSEAPHRAVEVATPLAADLAAGRAVTKRLRLPAAQIARPRGVRQCSHCITTLLRHQCFRRLRITSASRLPGGRHPAPPPQMVIGNSARRAGCAAGTWICCDESMHRGRYRYPACGILSPKRARRSHRRGTCRLTLGTMPTRRSPCLPPA
jgi:hypothetical protein